MNKLNDYLDHKTRQYIRTTGFDIKQPEAKAKLKAEIAPLLREWVAEAIAAGC